MGARLNTAEGTDQTLALRVISRFTLVSTLVILFNPEFNLPEYSPDNLMGQVSIRICVKNANTIEA